MPLHTDTAELRDGWGADRKEMKFPLPLMRNSRLQAVCSSCLALQCWSPAVKHAASPAVEWQLCSIGCNGNFSHAQLQWERGIGCYRQGSSDVGTGQAAPSLLLQCWAWPWGQGHRSACNNNNSHCFDYFF